MKSLAWMLLLLAAGVALFWLRPDVVRAPAMSGADGVPTGPSEARPEQLAPAKRAEEPPRRTESGPAAEERPQREAGFDSRARIFGIVRLGEGVVLGPGESLKGDNVEWLPEPTLVPRTDAQGEALAPLERWSSGGEVELRSDGTFVLEDLPLGKELTLELVSFLGESELVCAPLRPGEQRSVELVLTRGTIVREGRQGFLL
jgi:hypothetical protein